MVGGKEEVPIAVLVVPPQLNRRRNILSRP